MFELYECNFTYFDLSKYRGLTINLFTRTSKNISESMFPWRVSWFGIVKLRLTQSGLSCSFGWAWLKKYRELFVSIIANIYKLCTIVFKIIWKNKHIQFNFCMPLNLLGKYGLAVCLQGNSEYTKSTPFKSCIPYHSNLKINLLQIYSLYPSVCATVQFHTWVTDESLRNHDHQLGDNFSQMITENRNLLKDWT